MCDSHSGTKLGIKGASEAVLDAAYPLKCETLCVLVSPKLHTNTLGTITPLTASLPANRQLVHSRNRNQ
jgi:hypothetical protein